MREPSTNRLLAAMSLYGLLAASTFFTLDGEIRAVVLILFIGLAIMTWTAHERQKLNAQEAAQNDSTEISDGPRNLP
jgi:hypothetical protein